MQQNQRVSRLLTMLAITIGAQTATAQFKAGIILSAHSPMSTTADKLPGVRTGFSVAVAPDYTMGRIQMYSSVWVSR